MEVEDWEIPLGCYVRRRSHYVHEKILAVGRRSQNLDPPKRAVAAQSVRAYQRGTSTPRLTEATRQGLLSDSHQSVNRNVQDQGNDSGPPLCQYPFGLALLSH